MADQKHKRTAHRLRKRWFDGYGDFKGGDPRLFTPDPEASTEAEREAHRQACEAFARDGEDLPAAHRWETSAEARKAVAEGRAESATGFGAFAKTTYRMFGQGSYRMRVPMISRRTRRAMARAWSF